MFKNFVFCSSFFLKVGLTLTFKKEDIAFKQAKKSI